MSRDLTLDDFRRQFEQIQKMGMKDVLGSMPGKSDLIPEGEDPEQGPQTDPGHHRRNDQGGAAESRCY